MTDTTIPIVHNPTRRTSRKPLALIRNSGVEPAVDTVNAERSRRVAP
jgi:arsenate reductase-like glutaredoxin family protein